MVENTLPHNGLTCEAVALLYPLPQILKGVRIQLGLPADLDDYETFVLAFRKYSPAATDEYIRNLYTCCEAGAAPPLEVCRWFMALDHEKRQELLLEILGS